jgi:DNA-binding MarR family transcriptional regulator
VERTKLHSGLEFILGHIIQDFMQHMHQTGLSMPQIHALMHIYHAGECRISEIGELMGSSKAAGSQLVDRLVQQGLVQRVEDPRNRRVKMVRLTEKSQELIRQGVTSNHFLADLLAALPADQLETIHRAFEYLAQARQELHSTVTRKAEPHATHP